MTNFGTMRYKHIISVVLWSMFLVACGPDRRVALAEKLMAEKETDSAIAVMQEIKEPQNNLTDRDYALYALLLSEAMYNPQIQISAESETKRSIFREKDKTKRSKKESAQHSKSRNKSFVMTSVSAL